MRRIAVVGASLAALRAIEELRRQGFDGSLCLVGAEADLPYDRPPLSKQILSGEWGFERAALTDGDAMAALEVELRLGSHADGLDLEDRAVVVGDESVDFDGLLIATGARPRQLPGLMPAGVHTLRTLADARGLRADLDAGYRRLAVVGAGFIGAEVAATCRDLGCEVTMIEAAAVPMGAAVGDQMGRVMADLHRSRGVDLRLGVGVDQVTGLTRVDGVVLSDGTAVAADIVVVGIGVTPNTEWLEGSGLTIDNGVVCDATLSAAPGVVAAGDVARWPNGLFDEMMRVEHWDNAVEQGPAAGRRLLAGAGEEVPFRPVPWFWSDQYDRKIQVTGRTNGADEVIVAHGSIDDGRFVALYRRGDRLAGAFGMNRPRQIILARNMIADRATFADATEQLAQ